MEQTTIIIIAVIGCLVVLSSSGTAVYVSSQETTTPATTTAETTTTPATTTAETTTTPATTTAETTTTAATTTTAVPVSKCAYQGENFTYPAECPTSVLGRTINYKPKGSYVTVPKILRKSVGSATRTLLNPTDAQAALANKCGTNTQYECSQTPENAYKALCSTKEDKCAMFSMPQGVTYKTMGKQSGKNLKYPVYAHPSTDTPLLFSATPSFTAAASNATTGYSDFYAKRKYIA